MQCYEPGEVFVLPATGGVAKWLNREVGQELEIIYSVEDILRYYHIETDSLTNQFGAFPFIARVPEGQEREFAQKYRADPDVQVAIPNFHISQLQNPTTINLEVISEAISMLECTATAECGKDVKVAVIDTGVEPQLLQYPHKLFSKQYTTDRPADIKSSLAPYDPIGHGTTVARIINSIAPGATILSIKMMENIGNVGGLISAIYLAEAEFRPDIYNLSLAISCDVDVCGSCGNPQGAEAAVTSAQLQLLFELIDKREKIYGNMPLLVAAAGNNSRNVRMPASFPNVLAVGSYESSLGGNAIYANVEPDRFILAPGGLQDKAKCISYRMNSTWKKEDTFFGTSFSAAFVTAIAARFLCVTKKSPCGGTPPLGIAGNVPGRNFMMTCLKQGATQNLPNFSPDKHGLGVVHYNLSLGRKVYLSQFGLGGNLS